MGRNSVRSEVSRSIEDVTADPMAAGLALVRELAVYVNPEAADDEVLKKILRVSKRKGSDLRFLGEKF